MYDRYGRGERKESENKIQPTSVLSTTEHVCDPSREAKAEDGRRFKASLIGMPCLSHPTLKNPLGAVGEGVGSHRSLLCLFLLFWFAFHFFSLPAGLLTKRGTYSVQWPWLQTRGSWWGSEIAGDCDGRGCGYSSRCWRGAVLLLRQWSAGKEKERPREWGQTTKGRAVSRMLPLSNWSIHVTTKVKQRGRLRSRSGGEDSHNQDSVLMAMVSVHSLRCQLDWQVLLFMCYMTVTCSLFRCSPSWFPTFYVMGAGDRRLLKIKPRQCPRTP